MWWGRQGNARKAFCCLSAYYKCVCMIAVASQPAHRRNDLTPHTCLQLLTNTCDERPSQCAMHQLCCPRHIMIMLLWHLRVIRTPKVCHGYAQQDFCSSFSQRCASVCIRIQNQHVLVLSVCPVHTPVHMRQKTCKAMWHPSESTPCMVQARHLRHLKQERPNVL